jgi:hypothetical protein
MLHRWTDCRHFCRVDGRRTATSHLGHWSLLLLVGLGTTCEQLGAAAREGHTIVIRTPITPIHSLLKASNRVERTLPSVSRRVRQIGLLWELLSVSWTGRGDGLRRLTNLTSPDIPMHELRESRVRLLLVDLPWKSKPKWSAMQHFVKLLQRLQGETQRKLDLHGCSSLMALVGSAALVVILFSFLCLSRCLSWFFASFISLSSFRSFDFPNHPMGRTYYAYMWVAGTNQQGPAVPLPLPIPIIMAPKTGGQLLMAVVECGANMLVRAAECLVGTEALRPRKQ